MKFVVLFLLVSASAFARNNGQYAQNNPWWQDQLAPMTKQPCCSQADGVYAEEDIRKGDDGGSHYWVRWVIVNPGKADIEIPWMQVPDDVIIYNSKSPQGHPVVWWSATESLGKQIFKIRCFVPGVGI